MTVYQFTIPGKPVAKGRPRASARGGMVHMRTPKKTARWEAYAAHTMRLTRPRPQDPIREAVEVEVEAVFARPKAKTWKTRPMPRYPHTGRPDADNLAKAACDALEKAGIVHNDSQAYRVGVTKWIADGAEQPHVSITVKVVE